MQINRYSFPLSVHYIPEGIVHYMTECRQVTRRRRHKKKEKTFKKLYTISRNPCTVYPGIRCTVYPGINVHYVPEYSLMHNSLKMNKNCCKFDIDCEVFRIVKLKTLSK